MDRDAQDEVEVCPTLLVNGELPQVNSEGEEDEALSLQEEEEEELLDLKDEEGEEEENKEEEITKEDLEKLEEKEEDEAYQEEDLVSENQEDEIQLVKEEETGEQTKKSQEKPSVGVKQRIEEARRNEEKLREEAEKENLQKSKMSDKKSRFGGNVEKCAQCTKTVYAMEKMEVGGRTMHKTCFRCCKCNSPLSVGRFSIGGKDLYCMTHYKQAFREKGTYDVFTPNNPCKGRWETKTQ